MDLTQVGKIIYEWDFDKEEYQEWLNDIEDENGNPTQHSQETLMEYIEEGNVEFTLEFLDNETYHTMDVEYYDYSSLKNNFEERMVNEILQDCLQNGEGEIEMMLYYDEDIDVNNPSEVNRKAHQLFKPSEYYKGLRGFILTDGTIIETPAEHNECTRIPNVKGTYHFITLGNIRLLQNSIDVGQLPTQEQQRTLFQVIGEHENDTLYIDVISNKGEYGWQEFNPEPKQILNKLKQYFINGIKPLNENNNKTKNKTIMKITEKQLRQIIRESLEELNIGGGKVDFSDWHIRSMKVTEDGYYEFEAVTDNDWYTLRGTYYGNGYIDLDELLSGHSGYGRFITIDDKLQRWFDTYASKELIKKLDYWIENDMYDEPNYNDDEYE